MAIRKYLFWKRVDGICTYKVTGKGTFELMRYLGDEVFEGDDWSVFFVWFQKNAAITEDEFIDFCFLSEEKIESPLLEYSFSSTSSWDKKEIKLFCEQNVPAETYEIFYSSNESFVCQNGNVYDKDNVKKLFLKCIPEFSIDTEESIDVGSEETSLVSKYFIDRLNEVLKNN